MKNIFWGLIFILLDVNISVGHGIIDFLPDFIGYALIFAAARAMISKNNYFKKLMLWSGCLTFYSVCFWLLETFSFYGETVRFFIGIPLIAGCTVVMRFIVLAIEDIEKKTKTNLKALMLRKYFYSLSTAICICYIVEFFWPITVIPLDIVCAIVAFLFVFTFFQTKSIYYDK